MRAQRSVVFFLSAVALGIILAIWLTDKLAAEELPAQPTPVVINQPERVEGTGSTVMTPQKVLEQLGFKNLNWEELKNKQWAAAAPKYREAGGGSVPTSGAKNKIVSWRVRWNNYYSPITVFGTSTNWWLQTTVAKEGQGFQYTVTDRYGRYTSQVRLPAREAGAYAAGTSRTENQAYEMQIGWLDHENPLAGSYYQEQACPIGPDLHLIYTVYPGGTVSARLAVDNHSLYQGWYMGVVQFFGSSPWYYQTTLELEDEDTIWGDAGVVVIATDNQLQNICSITFWQDYKKSLSTS